MTRTERTNGALTRKDLDHEAVTFLSSFVASVGHNQ